MELSRGKELKPELVHVQLKEGEGIHLTHDNRKPTSTKNYLDLPKSVTTCLTKQKNQSDWFVTNCPKNLHIHNKANLKLNPHC